ncbi:MAG: hypothetical protein WC565_03285 [Parcubacteria group bacterium]|jgi:hypothetical protein
MYQVEDNGSNWKVWINPNIRVENEFDYNSSQYGKSGYKAALGYDPTPPAGYKLVYMLYPKSEWTKEELESSTFQLQTDKMAKKCNVCATLNALRTAEPQPQEQQVAVMPTTKQLSMGDVVAPTWVPKVAKVGQSLLCTKLGSVGVGVIGSIIADIMAGWSTDPGQKEAMKQISAQLIEMDINPDDMPMIREDALRMYDAWQDGGAGAALKAGFFKSFDDAVKDGIGVESKTVKTTTTHRRIGIRTGVASMVE